MNDPQMGVLLVFPRDDAKQLFAARSDELLTEFLAEYLARPVKSRPPELGLHRMWHLVHALLCGGQLAADGGSMPLNHVILGGRPLYSGEDKIVRMVRPDIVRLAATALQELDSETLQAAFDSIDFGELCHLDQIDHTTITFDSAYIVIQQIADLFDEAAQQGAAVVFYADFSSHVNHQH